MESVVELGGAPGQDDEVVFVLSGRTQLAGIGAGLNGGRVDDWLAHAVARKPADLRRHVQRIAHLCERRAPQTINALADLFMVLGESGYALRKRLFEQAGPLLLAADREWFKARLADGRAAQVAPPEGCVPLLGSGAAGTARLVERTKAASPSAVAGESSEDLLESVSEQLLQGELGAACGLLEDAICADPGNLALQRELARIFAYRDDPERRRACAARLRAHNVEIIAELKS